MAQGSLPQGITAPFFIFFVVSGGFGLSMSNSIMMNLDFVPKNDLAYGMNITHGCVYSVRSTDDAQIDKKKHAGVNIFYDSCYAVVCFNDFVLEKDRAL